MPSPPRLALHVTGSTDGIRRALDAFAVFVAEHGCLPDATWKAQVALDEALSNIVTHAYRGAAGGSIDITCTIGDDEMHVTVADHGAPYNPLSAPAPDTRSPLELRRPGGLGVRLITELMDSVEYSRCGDRNVLAMRQRLSRERTR